MTHKVDERTNILSLIDDISEEQNDIELGKIVEQRINDGQPPIRVILDDL